MELTMATATELGKQLDPARFLLETHDTSLDVRITHQPSGISAVGTGATTQHENGDRALEQLLRALSDRELDAGGDPWVEKQTP